MLHFQKNSLHFLQYRLFFSALRMYRHKKGIPPNLRYKFLQNLLGHLQHQGFILAASHRVNHSGIHQRHIARMHLRPVIFPADLHAAFQHINHFQTIVPVGCNKAPLVHRQIKSGLNICICSYYFVSHDYFLFSFHNSLAAHLRH